MRKADERTDSLSQASAAGADDIDKGVANARAIRSAVTNQGSKSTALVARIDELVTEVLGYYAENVFTPATKEDYERMNKMDANLNTRLHCAGIRHGLHQLRRAARGLDARDELPVIKVPDEHNGSQQASPDLLETERKRVLAEIEKELYFMITEQPQPTPKEWLDGFNTYRTHTLEVIERLRGASVRKAEHSPETNLNNGDTQHEQQNH